MKCLKCFAEIEETKQVCPNCGLPLTSEAFKKAGLNRRTGWITFFSIWNYILFGIHSLYAIVFLIVVLTGSMSGVAFGFFIVIALLAVVYFACAYGLWHLKSYGRTIQLVLAFIWLLGIPIGTVLGILALVHLFKPEVKKLFTGQPLEEFTQEEIMKISIQAKMKQAVIFAVIAIPVSIIIIGMLAAILIPNAIIAIQKAKQKAVMKDIIVISTAIADHVTDSGAAPTQDGTYDTSNNFYVALSPFYVKILPITDQWGNNFVVYCGTACNGKYGITGCGTDDFIVVSLGRDGEMEYWEFDKGNPESGLYIFNQMEHFDRDLVMWNGSWIRAPGEVSTSRYP